MNRYVVHQGGDSPELFVAEAAGDHDSTAYELADRVCQLMNAAYREGYRASQTGPGTVWSPAFPAYLVTYREEG